MAYADPSRTEVPVHLANAARTLERLLNARDPRHIHVITVLGAGTQRTRV